MQYVTSYERIGIKKGTLETSREDIVEILKARFELVPDSIITFIDEMEDLSALKELLRKAATVESIDEFQDVLGFEAVKK